MRRGSALGAASWRVAMLCEELARRGASFAVVPFSGRGGSGGGRERSRSVVATVMSSSTSSGGALVTSSRSRDLCGIATAFGGHLWIRAPVTLMVADRCLLIAGQRCGEAFDEGTVVNRVHHDMAFA
jgi:hypothetical protein